MRIAALILLFAVSGCENSSTPQARSAPTTQPISFWPVGISPDEARNLTPDECKAILVAKAAIEASEGHAVHANFKVAKQGNDWIVTVLYTAPAGYQTALGDFTAV